MRSRGMVVAAVLGVAFVSGGWLMRDAGGATADTPTAADGARLFNAVFARVRQNAVDTLSDAQLYRKAVDGMLGNLRDPHSVFLDTERFTSLQESTTGTYGGLGIQIDVRDGWIAVVAPLPGTPAERAGIQTGDRVVAIDGRSTQGLSPDEAMKSLRGAAGSKVTLSIERPGAGAAFPVPLVRREIHVRAVQRALEIAPGVGYVDVNIFSETTTDELQRAVDSLRRAGARSLVLDLRGNPGGLLDQGVSVSDLFLDRGQRIVSMRGRTPDANRTLGDVAPQRWPEMPMVVLVSRGSASASEIVAGALQDHDRAVIVGRTTYGKGSAQSVFRVAGGGALKLTTARWYTPVGRSINRPLPDDDAEDDGELPVADGPRPSDDADSVPVARRERFTTDGGRTVFGGGGITPDVMAGDTALPGAQLALQRALGASVAKFRDAVSDYAVALKLQGALATPTSPITPVMRQELYRRLITRGVRLDRAIFDSAGTTIDRVLGAEVARYQFGTTGEFTRAAADDPAMQAAVRMLSGAPSHAELLKRALVLQRAQLADTVRQ